MEIESNKSGLFELRCAAGSWLDGVKEGETFCIFTKKGANLKKDLKNNNFYCVLPRELYQKFFWAQYPKAYEIEGKNRFGVLKKEDAYTTADFLQQYKSKNLFN